MNNRIHLFTRAYEDRGELSEAGCCMDGSREKKTDGREKDVCLTGEVNKIEAVL